MPANVFVHNIGVPPPVRTFQFEKIAWAQIEEEETENITKTATVLWRFLLANVSDKKTNKHKHFGRDGVRDKQEPSLGQTGPLPGPKWDPSLGQTGPFLFNLTVKSPFSPVCPWDGWGFVPVGPWGFGGK